MDRPIMPPRPVPTHAGPGGHIYGEIAFWVKGEEARLIKSRELTVIIRQDDRSSPELKQWLPEDEPVPIFFLDAEAAKGGPLGFETDDGTSVRVRRFVRQLGEIEDADLRFNGGRAVPTTGALVKDYLENELAPGKTFGIEHPITIYHLEYIKHQREFVEVTFGQGLR